MTRYYVADIGDIGGERFDLRILYARPFFLSCKMLSWMPLKGQIKVIEFLAVFVMNELRSHQ